MVDTTSEEDSTLMPAPAARPRKKRGRPARGDVRQTAKIAPLKRQRQQSLDQMMADIPTFCDRGTKCNAQCYKVSWNDYKLHINTTDYCVPVATLLSSASMHDSRAAIPLSLNSASRVTNLNDVMDAAYCSVELHAHCRSLNQVPLIDHNPRSGVKKEFEPANAINYAPKEVHLEVNERTVAECSNGQLKDNFDGETIRVQGAMKVMRHQIFGILALATDQLMRLRQ